MTSAWVIEGRAIVGTEAPAVISQPTVSLDAKAVKSVAQLLVSFGATQVFVFGSATKGGLRADSDVDIAVRGLPPALYFAAVSKASDLLGRPVDLVDLDDPTPLIRYLLGSGELVRVA